LTNTLLALSIFVIGCEDNQEIYDEIDLVYNINLPVDDNGYYHMELSDSWQTIQRLTATLESTHLNNREYGERDLVETIKVYWESSHYWVLGDTLGYIVKRGLTDDLEYVNYDTLYIWGFEGESVPTVNGASYPVNVNDDTWEVNTMTGPVSSMVGDTMTVINGAKTYFQGVKQMSDRKSFDKLWKVMTQKEYDDNYTRITSSEPIRWWKDIGESSDLDEW